MTRSEFIGLVFAAPLVVVGLKKKKTTMTYEEYMKKTYIPKYVEGVKFNILYRNLGCPTKGTVLRDSGKVIQIPL